MSKWLKKPNAANITHGLAQLGGGSRKEGGGGMMAGMEYVFAKGFQMGKQQAISEIETKSNSGKIEKVDL